MNIFLGSLYPRQLYDELIKRGQFVDYPANVFQHSLLKGLDEHFDDLLVITSPVIRSKYSIVKDISHKSVFSHKEDNKRVDINVGVLSIPGLQIIVEFYRVYKELKKLLDYSKEDNTLVIYALHSPFLLSALLLRKKIVCTCVVVPDLPEFMTSNNGVIRRIMKRIDRGIINFCIRRLDCFALLSPYMREKLPIKDKPWVLMEGIYDTSAQIDNVQRHKERVIFYGGSLSRRYGILDLLGAFRKINNENYRLWICGDGDGKDDVKKMEIQDERVKYFGVIRHQKVLELQRQATVLINPRHSTDEYTKYSFPSKTMEYLASGTPTIMCHLPAIPKEYDEYLFYITDENEDGIKQKLLEVCNKPQCELNKLGDKAACFIRSQKNAFAQAQKIKNVIEEFKSKRVITPN